MGAGFGSFVDGLFGGYKAATDLMNAREDLQMKMLKNQQLRDYVQNESWKYDPTDPRNQGGAGPTGKLAPPFTGTGGAGGGPTVGEGGVEVPGTGGGGGGGGGSGGDNWGPLAYQAVDYFTKQGYSGPAIQGILANGLSEGGFNELWRQSTYVDPKTGKREESYGPWQLHKGADLDEYLSWAAKNGVQDTQQLLPQMQWIDSYVRQHMPWYINSTDPRKATDDWQHHFERPAARFDYPGARYGHLTTVQTRLNQPMPPGAPQTALAPGGGVGTGGQIQPGYEGNPPAPAVSPEGQTPVGTENNPPPAAEAQPKTALATTPSLSTSSTPPLPGSPIAYGDSIAGGFVRFGGLGGTHSTSSTDPDATTADGRTPDQVLKFLSKIPDGAINRPVVLSTGVSNDPSMIGLVPQQIAELKRAGATKVKLLGVGDHAGYEGTGKNRRYYNLAPNNPTLKQYADADPGYVVWGGPLPAVVHPDPRTYYRSNAGMNPWGS